MRLNNKKNKSIIAFLLTIVMCVTLLPNILMEKVHAVENVASTEYEIYPIPQSIEYKDGSLKLEEKVNVIFEDTIDEATKNRLFEVLEIKNIEYTVGEEINNDTTNFLVGTEDSNGVVDNYFSEKKIDDKEHFKKIDSHIISVEDNVVAVLGKDTDSAFYGITTLKMIFNQLEENEIYNLLIKDYSDAQWRGFIEGYYGIPWSNEDRMSLMEFGGDIKMNSYMFAPKDDEYHSSRWREPYPQDKLNEIKEMVEVGTKSKNKFIWTIHPFMNNAMRFDTEENYQADLKTIIDKFEQMYSIGVRQFGVLADDAGGEAENQLKLLIDLNKWKESKKDVYSLIFVPKEYCQSFSSGIDSPYLKTINKMPRDIEIMWTGDGVCGWVTEKTFDWLNTALTSEGHPGREAVMWLNWPVNDINSARLLMGKGQMLDPNVTNFKGVVSNPMQEAEASKVALFAVADYNWNRDTFNADKSWEDSFKYIDKDAGEELYTIAKHNSDPAPNGHGLVQNESEEIKPLLDEFNRQFADGESIKEIGQTLINEYEIIVKATDDFATKSKNEKLKSELESFRLSLKAVAISTIEYIKTAIALEEGNNGEVWSHYSEAAAQFELSKTYEKQNLNGRVKVESGYKRLIPFVKNLGESLADKVNEVVNPGEDKITMRPYTNIPSIYQGDIKNIVDGKDDTYVWFGNYNAVGHYIGLEFSKEIGINNIRLEQGRNATDKDAFNYGKFQYSSDGENWTDVDNGKTYGPEQNTILVENLNITAKHLRFIQTEASSKWASFREFAVNEEIEKEPLNLTFMKSNNIAKRQGPNESDLVTDAGTASSVMYSEIREDGSYRDGIPKDAYVGVDLGKEVKVGQVHILQGQDVAGDIFSEAVLEYSVDGVNYTEIERFDNTREIKKDYTSNNIIAKYIRLRNLEANNVWARFNKFNVKESTLNTNLYTNVTELADNKITVEESIATIEGLDNITLQKDQYVGIELPRIRDLTKIVADYTNGENLTLETSMNEIEWTVVTDMNSLEDARYIRIINKTNEAITFNVNNLKVESLEYKAIEMSSHNFGTVENPNNAFDGNITTQAWLRSNQDAGKKIVYDLGRNININSLKMVLNDFEIDFIRNGKISLSEDGENWTDALIIGGDFGADAKIEDVYPNHEISYYTISQRDLDVNARYLKVEITKSPGISKWARFNEIIINDGEYIPSENDPTFVSNPIEVAGYAPTALIDGNLNTTYKANTEISQNGSLVYRISKNTNIKSINILQSPSTISNAVVSVRTIDGWTELGILNRSLNDFITTGLGNILEIKIEWDGVSPTLHEIILSTGDKTVDKSSLEAKVEEGKNIDTTNWTIESKEALRLALEEAERVLADKYASQNKVDETLRQLALAIENPEIVEVNKAELQELYNTNKDRVESEYTTESWIIFKESLNISEIVLSNENATQEEVDNALAGLIKAVDGLKENVEEPDEEIVIEKIKNLKDEASTNEVKLTWDAPSSLVGVTGYVIYKDGKILEEVDVNVTEYVATNLRANTNYGFKVVTKYSNEEVSKPVSTNVRTKKN